MDTDQTTTLVPRWARPSSHWRDLFQLPTLRLPRWHNPPALPDDDDDESGATPAWAAPTRPSRLPPRQQALLGIAVALAVALVILLAVPGKSSSSAPPAAQWTVSTASGQLRGVLAGTNGVTAFKGVPFAASTAGEGRWRAPRAAERWDGVRDAAEFGEVCPQSRAGGDEDCLSLNVWVPDGADGAAVYVWIFGGRFSGGAGSDAAFDGQALAEKGVVVVTFNYRLGLLGFLAHPELSDESGKGSGNYGLLDQIAALEWVADNIEAFGGDPEKVTIGGQSAGAASVMHMIDSPLARGLFRGGIIQSGALNPRDPQLSGLAASYRTLDTAEQQGIDTLKALSVSTISELRALSVDALLKENGGNDPVAGHPPIFRPVLDGYVKERTYEDALLSGAQSDVFVVAGSNQDEGTTSADAIALETYLEASNATYGALAAEYLSLYPAENDAEAAAASNAAARESARTSLFLWAQLRAQKASRPTWTYYWTQAPPAGGMTGPPSGGAFHGSEIKYTFNNVGKDGLAWTEDDFEIAETMSDYWATFVKHADPNGEGLAEWPVSEAGTARTMLLGKRMEGMEVATAEKVEFWTRYYKTVEEVW